MDSIDRAILSELEKNGAMTLKELSEKLGMPLTTVHYRKKMLEERGIIVGYRPIIDRKAAGQEPLVLVFGNGDASNLRKLNNVIMVMKIKSSNWNVVVLAYAENSIDRLVEKLMKSGMKDISPVYVEEVIE